MAAHPDTPQMSAIHGVSADVVALTQGTQRWYCDQARELGRLATEADRTYSTMLPAVRGILLAEMLTALMHLHSLGGVPVTDPDDVMNYYAVLMPSIRDAISFVSGEIAALARRFNLVAAGTQAVLAAQSDAFDSYGAYAADRNGRARRWPHTPAAGTAAGLRGVGDGAGALFSAADPSNPFAVAPSNPFAVTPSNPFAAFPGAEAPAEVSFETPFDPFGPAFDPDDLCELFECDGDCDADCACFCHEGAAMSEESEESEE